MSNIPAEYIEFCKAIASLCREAKLRSFGASFSPGFGSKWRDDITIAWHAGRHDEDSDDVIVTSTVTIRTGIVPIPAGVYYGEEGGNFYGMKDGRPQGMGLQFWNKWRERRNEFPKSAEETEGIKPEAQP